MLLILEWIDVDVICITHCVLVLQGVTLGLHGILAWTAFCVSLGVYSVSSRVTIIIERVIFCTMLSAYSRILALIARILFMRGYSHHSYGAGYSVNFEVKFGDACAGEAFL